MRIAYGTRIREPGLTMVELLVCLGVLAIALGSVLSIFVAGTRFAAKSRRRMDASRVARAVFDLANSSRSGAGWGRDENGLVHDATITNLSGAVVPPGMVVSPTPLVWRAEILTPNPYTFDVPDMHLLVTTVSYDLNENGSFDTEPDDEVIGTYCAILADR